MYGPNKNNRYKNIRNNISHDFSITSGHDMAGFRGKMTLTCAFGSQDTVVTALSFAAAKTYQNVAMG